MAQSPAGLADELQKALSISPTRRIVLNYFDTDDEKDSDENSLEQQISQKDERIPSPRQLFPKDAAPLPKPQLQLQQLMPHDYPQHEGLLIDWINSILCPPRTTNTANVPSSSQSSSISSRLYFRGDFPQNQVLLQEANDLLRQIRPDVLEAGLRFVLRDTTDPDSHATTAGATTTNSTIRAFWQSPALLERDNPKQCWTPSGRVGLRYQTALQGLLLHRLISLLLWLDRRKGLVFVAPRHSTVDWWTSWWRRIVGGPGVEGLECLALLGVSLTYRQDCVSHLATDLPRVVGQLLPKNPRSTSTAKAIAAWSVVLDKPLDVTALTRRVERAWMNLLYDIVQYYNDSMLWG